MARTTTSDKIAIDPIFQIPPGAEDVFTYTTDSVGADLEGLNTDDDFTDDGTGDTDALPVPTNIQIVSQTLRRAPGGQNVVDVVISIDEVDGADGYDIQVTKTS